MRVLSQIVVIFFLVTAGLNYSAYSFVIQLDSFNITKNFSTLMNDDFSDTAGLGLAGPMTEPSNDGGNPPLGIYSVIGGGAQSEGTVAGNRTFDTSGAPITASSVTPGTFVQNTFIELRTNQGDVTVANGLKKDDTFVVEAIVSLGDLSDLGNIDSYGIRLRDRDRITGTGNDQLDLRVRRNGGGNTVVSLRHRDNITNVSTILEEIALSVLDLMNHDQIMLTLFKTSDSTDTISASFNLLNGGAPSGVQNFAATFNIFNGEDWTRANFLAIDVNVPEPATLTIFGLGLAGLGLMRRRRRKAA